MQKRMDGYTQPSLMEIRTLFGTTYSVVAFDGGGEDDYGVIICHFSMVNIKFFA